MDHETDAVTEYVDEAALQRQFEQERVWLLYTETVSELAPWERHEACREGSQVPARSAVEALSANRRVINLLTERRWYVMRDAREIGVSWAEIGDALGMSRQGAHDWYRRAIAQRAAVDVEYQTGRDAGAL